MDYMNIIEKLQIFMNLITNSQLLMGTIVLIALSILLFLNKQINNKKLFRVVLLINIGAFLIMLFLNSEQLITIYNSIIDKIFMNFYFPSVEIYLFILLFMFVVLFVSIFNIKMKKSYKITNIIAFFSFFYLFLMLVNIIVTNNLNIFDINSIYTNKEAVAILELSTLVYVLWLIILLIISISNTVYAYILNKRKNEVTQEVGDSVDALREEAYTDNIDDSYIPNGEFEYSLSESVNNEVLVEKNNINIDKKSYSLEDYKTFNSILKQIIILNGYKSKITLEDLLNENMLAIFSEEEVTLYKKILLSTIN